MILFVWYFALPIIVMALTVWFAVRLKRQGSHWLFLTFIIFFGGLLTILASPFLRFLMFSFIGWGFISAGVGVPWESSRNSIDIHYRLDVNLMVDGESVTGSVVQGIRKRAGISVPVLGMGPATQFYGQALVLDLPGGRPSLIVPMAMAHLYQSYGHNEGEEVFLDGYGHREAAYERFFFLACGFYTLPGREKRAGFALNDAEDSAQWFHWLNSFEGNCDVTPDLMPIFLSINGNYDPRSIQIADPDNLSSQFGSGIEFVSAIVTVVDEPVAKDIESILPWVIELYSSARSNNRPTFVGTEDLNILRHAILRKAL